jgi:hypothetical protein
MVVGFASGDIVTVPGFAPGLERRRIRGLSRRRNFDRFDMAGIVTHGLAMSGWHFAGRQPERQ